MIITLLRLISAYFVVFIAYVALLFMYDARAVLRGVIVTLLVVVIPMIPPSNIRLLELSQRSPIYIYIYILLLAQCTDGNARQSS